MCEFLQLYLDFFELECATNDCKVIFFSKFSCFFDKCFKLINSTVDGFCKMEINFIIIIWSTNRNIVNKYSFYCFFFINISNITTTTVIFGFILLLFYFWLWKMYLETLVTVLTILTLISSSSLYSLDIFSSAMLSL